ncbi:hypothetical protein [Streptomyces asoensis]|uniref:Uncharacterized protein n=1 Tax=Streptomyces asoensis TaxID=249586 RepID=A0ABQ3S772_9ACTN|nr:hypothetical protein [Streptomyces asoensis]GGQ76781.1 hypothetical protein GCM10010496_45410 [Streptomyces asoensis]GHI63973.1 hypothetical protein Saso_56230 [Streptomyces asoensis]
MTSEAPHRARRPEAEHEPSGQDRVEVRLVSADPEAARRVADALRLLFAADEQRSYPSASGTGTRLHLTVDASRAAGPLASWLKSSRPAADRTHPGETA